jgi:hypothetical protein
LHLIQTNHQPWRTLVASILLLLDSGGRRTLLALASLFAILVVPNKGAIIHDTSGPWQKGICMRRTRAKEIRLPFSVPLPPRDLCNYRSQLSTFSLVPNVCILNGIILDLIKGSRKRLDLLAVCCFPTLYTILVEIAEKSFEFYEVAMDA